MTDYSPLVVAIGAILWDVFPDGERLGGAPANFVVHAKAMGARAAMVSCVGNDERGKDALDILAGRGVSTEAMQVHPDRPTGTVPVTLVNGQPAYEIVEGVAWDAITWHDELSELAQSAHAICFGTLDQRETQSREAIINFLDAASPDCLRVLDVNVRQHYHSQDVVQGALDRADILKLNDEEIPLLRDYVGGPEDDNAFLDSVRERCDLQCVILTLGEKGCRVIGSESVFTAQGEKQIVENTVGAGDAFTAAFVLNLLTGKDLPFCAEQANHVGGYVTTQDGGMPKLPTSFKVF